MKRFRVTHIGLDYARIEVLDDDGTEVEYDVAPGLGKAMVEMLNPMAVVVAPGHLEIGGRRHDVTTDGLTPEEALDAAWGESDD